MVAAPIADVQSAPIAAPAPSDLRGQGDASVLIAAAPDAKDQAVFQRALNTIQASRSNKPTGRWDYAQYQGGSMIEPGVYDAGGLQQDSGAVRLVARIPGTVIIRVPENQYFMTVSGRVNGVTVDGITFVGGKGAFNFTNTGNNVNLLHSFTRDFFYDYTECAICNNALDHPLLTVRDNIFMARTGSQAIGLGWGGFLDNVMIDNNGFFNNGYQLVLGPRLSGSFHVINNGFLSFGEKTQADIWIKPMADKGTWGVNSGFGSTIVGNKFGNENINTAAPRILIANEDPATGPTRATMRPSDEDAGFVSGLTIMSNRISSGGRMQAPFLRSSISNLRQLYWRNNNFDGSGYTYLVEFTHPRRMNFDNTTSDVEISTADLAGGDMAARRFSNALFGQLRDYAGLFPGDGNAVDVYPVSDDPGLVLLGKALAPMSRTAFGGATPTPGGGGLDLIHTAPGQDSGAALRLTGASSQGGMSFVEMRLGGVAGGAGQVMVELVNQMDGQVALRRLVAVPATTGRFVTPVLLPPSSQPQGWRLAVFVPGKAFDRGDFLTGSWVVNAGPGRMGIARAAGGMRQ